MTTRLTTRVATRVVTRPRTAPRGKDGPFSVRVSFAKRLAAADLIDYLTSTQQVDHYDDKEAIVQAFNIFRHHYVRSNETLAAISATRTFPIYPHPVDMMPLGEGLLAVRGFFASVRVATARVLVNINVTHGVFFAEMRLDNFIENYRDKRVELPAALNKMKVKVTHLPKKTPRTAPQSSGCTPSSGWRHKRTAPISPRGSGRGWPALRPGQARWSSGWSRRATSRAGGATSPSSTSSSESKSFPALFLSLALSMSAWRLVLAVTAADSAPSTSHRHRRSQDARG